jgi:hypothetical protein
MPAIWTAVRNELARPAYGPLRLVNWPVKFLFRKFLGFVTILR